MSFAPDEDHSHAHGHGTGVKWLDIMVGVSAMFISVVSLVVSIQHGKTMEEMVNQNERMVEANTLPMLQIFHSASDTQAPSSRYTLNLKNTGVGPAIIDWFDVRYKNQSYGDPTAFLHACCMDPAAAHVHLPDGVFFSNVSGTVIPARETIKLFEATDKAPPELIARLDQVRTEIDIHACYCSVLEHCWMTDFGGERPHRVEVCKVPKDVNPW